MMRTLCFITHADVVIDPAVPVPQWSLSARGRQRHDFFSQSAVVANVTSIYCSDEQKAQDGAAMLADYHQCGYTIVHDLHENDRSSTGFLPPDEFEQVADQFFAQPDLSVRGWETACDAQERIYRAIIHIIYHDQGAGDIAVISHGGVGTLLLCKLCGYEISRQYDQPGCGGGNYFVIDCDTLAVEQSWQPIDGPVV